MSELIELDDRLRSKVEESVCVSRERSRSLSEVGKLLEEMINEVTSKEEEDLEDADLSRYYRTGGKKNVTDQVVSKQPSSSSPSKLNTGNEVKEEEEHMEDPYPFKKCSGGDVPPEQV